jgi:glycine hydroxymethyltransferase
MHVVAAKAVAFKAAMTQEFRDQQQRTVDGAKIVANRLNHADVVNAGISILTGGTDVHLVPVDLRNAAIDGQTAENILHEAGVTVNKNSVPNDPRPPMVTSGIRIGTAALATRGFGEKEFEEVADIIALALLPGADLPALRKRVVALTDAFPLYQGLEDW